MTRIGPWVVVLLVLLVLAIAPGDEPPCADLRWVEDLDGQPLAQCYDALGSPASWTVDQ
jgi:hypothetical protein